MTESDKFKEAFEEVAAQYNRFSQMTLEEQEYAARSKRERKSHLVRTLNEVERDITLLESMTDRARYRITQDKIGLAFLAQLEPLQEVSYRELGKLLGLSGENYGPVIWHYTRLLEIFGLISRRKDPTNETDFLVKVNNEGRVLVQASREQ